MPGGLTIPRPVTTTRLMMGTEVSWRTARVKAPRSGAAMLLQIVDRILDGQDLFGGVIGDFHREFLLERHHELDGVKTIRAKIINKAGAFRDFGLINAQMLDDHLLNWLSD